MCEDEECARTSPLKISSGIPDWKKWCRCKKQCGKKWSFIWLHHLQCMYQSKNRKGIDRRDDYISKLTDIRVNKVTFYLVDRDNQKHEVCKDFFKGVFQIGKKKIQNICRSDKVNLIAILPEEKEKRRYMEQKRKRLEGKSG